jgi:aspartyl-tRNA(Asn)/glutamyl-tRNA(Gln) amidotransferase subunit A
LKQPVANFRLGTPTGYFDHLDPEVAAAVNEAIAVLAKMTKGAKEMALPLANMPPAGAAETIAYHQDYFKSAAMKYMIPERRRLEALAANNGGTAIDYVKGMWENQLLRRTIDDAFTDFEIDDLIKRSLETKPLTPAVTSNCSPFNIFGLPAISIPCGYSKDGLPIGLMIAGPRFSEGKILALAQAYERATGWSKRKPPLAPDTVKPNVVAY